MKHQLGLDLRLRDGSSFENFCNAGNEEVVQRVRRLLEEPPPSGPATLFVSGESATGKSHLLQAACRHVHAQGQRALYAPLGDIGVEPRLLDAAEECFLACVDDVQRVAGNAAWEAALLVLWERSRASGTRVICAATAAPMQLGLSLPDLSTRLASGPVYVLHGLSDADKIEAVRLRARNRGLDVSVEDARYILNRYPRDLFSLFALLDRIDIASLANQRRVTIPFLRELDETRAPR